MESVSAEQILEAAMRRAGIPGDEGIDTDFFPTGRDALESRLREGWRWQDWPDLREYERRHFAKVWNDTVTAAAGSQWYYLGKYYVALAATTEPPRDEDGELNTDWAELAETQSAEDWDETIEYAAGKKVYYPLTESFYQTYTPPTAGTLPTDATAWGLVPNFNRYVAYDQILADGSLATPIGDVMGVTRLDPRTTKSPCPVPFFKSADGIQVREVLSFVWVTFRRRAPQIKGEVYDPDATYAIGRQVYFTPAGGEGNFYNCLAAAAALENPEDAPAKWELVELPRFLKRWLVQSIYADSLDPEKQSDRAGAALGTAYRYLDEEVMVLCGQEGQEGNYEVKTR